MGRLFWKFFFFFWLAQLTAGVGVGLSFWLKHRVHERPASAIDTSPPAAFAVRAAAATLRYGGAAALRALLEEEQRQAQPPVFALIDRDREILDRALAEETRRRVLEAEPPPGIAQLVAADGHSYLLFALPGSNSRHREAPPPAGEAAAPPLGAPPPPRVHSPIPAAPLVAGFLVSLLFAALLAWYFAKPIGSLRAAFAAAAVGRLEPRLASAMGRRRDELADLGHDFDRMAQQLQRLMDGQRRLLHDVSHELRSPLSRLQAAIGLARQQPQRTDELLTRIERESMRMERLVGELLTLSRLEAGMARQFEAAVDLHELLASLLEDARFEAQAGGCRVDYAAPAAPACIPADAELLHRALENIVRNALKHSPPGGTVRIELAADALRDAYRIRVADSGKGVPEADLPAIFAPFFRSGRSATPDGYGLGLAISQRVVGLHGGTITAENRPEGGLCVTVFLPRRAAAEFSARCADAAAAPASQSHRRQS